MKHNKFFRIIAVAVVLALLVIALPTTSALAAALIELDFDKGQVGDKVTVDGAGFTPSTPPDHLFDVDIYFSSDYIEVGEDIDYYSHIYALVKEYVYIDESGSFSKFFYVPAVLEDGRDEADVLGGDYYIYITYGGDAEIRAFTEFTVLGVTGIEPGEGPVGTEVEMDGLGFDGGDDISVTYDDEAVDIVRGDRRVKSSGIFNSSIEIPESTAGSHTITVSDEAGHSGQVHFIVMPNITFGSTQASAGEEVIINGTGFGEGVDIFVYFDGDVVYITGDYETNDFGSFESAFLMPSEVLPGTYDVEVEDDLGYNADATLEVGPGLEISPVTSATTPGNVGDTVELNGSGFLPSHELTITYASDPVTFTTTSLPDGSFAYSFTLPPSPAGEPTISVTDGTSTKETVFFMESTPPEAPVPLLPAAETKAKSKAQFDWEDVSDASLPMSYELQVATNSQFTADSILVDQVGLTASTYTLSDEEKLESTDEEAPYYWRVRARDAASNPSDWTVGSSFTVGASFSMPSWLIYTLIAIGVILVFFLGLWLGRRSAVSEDYYY